MKKKALAFTAALTLALSLTADAAANSLPRFLLGGNAACEDLNDDNVINVVDLLVQKRSMLKSKVLNTIHVDTLDELLSALRAAQAGDEIVVASGTYIATSGQTKGSFFYSAGEGTSEHPIYLRAENPDEPPVLSGTGLTSGYIMYLTGDYWEIGGITFTSAQKGIVLDNVNHTIISDCTITQTGSEGIALRDNSSDCIISGTTVSYTGQITPGYGEGIYIGSWYGETKYGHSCDNNLVTGCTLGPGIAAEHIDIKEMTTGSIVENCIMHGSGISGENYADSFIDIAGNNAIVRNNTMYRENNTTICDAVQVHYQTDGWGTGNIMTGNRLELDDGGCYIAYCEGDCSISVSNNERLPDGNTYHGEGMITQ